MERTVLNESDSSTAQRRPLARRRSPQIEDEAVACEWMARLVGLKWSLAKTQN